VSKILDWIREPTTLQGLGLLSGAMMAAWLGVDGGVPSVMASTAIFLLIPEKSPLQKAASIAAGAAITEIGKHPLLGASSAAASTDEPKAPT